MNDSWQSHRERSNPVALKLIRWIALSLGRPVARLTLYPITLYFLLFASAQRKASLQYLSRVLNKKPTVINVAKHIHCFASTILDRIYLISGRFDVLNITFPSQNMPLAYSKDGTGCILLGSHVGSFEILRSYALKKCPLPVKILMYEGQTPMIVNMLHSINPALADTIIQLDGNPNSIIKVKEAVETGTAVGMLGDRIMNNSNDKTVTCTLLGEQVEMPIAPVLIAATLKVPLIVFFGIFHGGNQYQIHFELLSEKVVLNRKNRKQDIQRYVQEYANILEKYLIKYPYNWFNFYDYWQDDNVE
ncbi:MAG: hypothetical protein ACKE51_04755 [Methylococcaceae bacterium]